MADPLEALLRPLAGVLNRNIREMTPAREACARLEGRTVAIRVRDTALAMYFIIEDGRLVLATSAALEPDVVITGSPLTLAGMLRSGGELVADADLIAPVPLHWTRLFARRYNQAALLALAIGKQSGIRVVPDLLVRRKRTSPLGKLGPSARRKTVQHAFTIPARKIPIVSGRRVLLIDDVHTTGATVNACSHVLLRAGAAAVDVLSVARTVRPAY